MTPREAKRCDCCGYMERAYRHVELRQDGVTRLDLTLCRRCATTAEDALAVALRR